jgi:damage-control phosphatase, subfamily I
MNTALDCLPCFLRQALDAARFVSDDPALHERLMRELLKQLSEISFDRSPVYLGQQMHRRLRELAGNLDPYAAIKQQFDEMALAMLPSLQKRVAAAADPLMMALRLAIAGNRIDLASFHDLTLETARDAVNNVLDAPFAGDVEALRQAVARAERIVYLADNAGEIVFDRLLLEQLPLERTTVAVRGHAVLNDATVENAERAGLPGWVELIDNGSDAPGTLLDDTSEEFRACFDRADLILAKGQGNFESLSDHPGPVWFLLEVKCAVAAAHVGLPLGTHALLSPNR